MFRYGSSSSVTSAKSPPPSAQSQTTPGTPNAGAPTDPLPSGGTAPHSVLINRCHEVKRITKSLVNYFDGLATAHNNHGLAIAKLAGPGIIQAPLQESSLFLPAATTSTHKSDAEDVSANGWGDLLKMTKDATQAMGEDHQAFARNLSKNVVVPLKKLRPDIKSHIANMEKELGKLADAVTKERDASNVCLTALSNALGPDSHAETICGEDPVILRAAVEAQLRQQVTKENEMLAAVINWTERTEAKEKEVFREIGRCWTVFESANSNLHLGNQQRSMLLSGEVDTIAPDAEWTFFSKLHHVIPADTAPRRLEDIEYTGREDPLTQPVREGVLERQKRFLKTWATGFWILSPSGHLHSYASSTSPISHPAVSLPLRHCTLGPMPTPEVGSKGKQLEAMFTVDAPDGKYVLRAKSWEELSAWWTDIEKFTKKAEVPAVVGDDQDPQVALAAEREQAEREMQEANAQRLAEEEARLQNGTAEGDRGDLGAAAAVAAADDANKGAPPTLPPRSPAAQPISESVEPTEVDIGSSAQQEHVGDIGSATSDETHRQIPSSPPPPAATTSSAPILTEVTESPGENHNDQQDGDISQKMDDVKL
ncbi:hypothetical protein OIV83_001920 [Microbotryomycetes sp. JL201]|nr:hypothetical protein OIV83_001920 [Microbotryomycetes sp. JL201]